MPRLALTLTLSLALAACGLITPATQDPQEAEAAIRTAAAGTVAASLPTNPPPQPTSPPVVTATAVTVGATPSPEPTLTPIGAQSSPTVPATPDPNRNVSDIVLYEDSFDGTAGWFWTFSDEVADFGAKDGELKIVTKQGNNTWRYVFRDDVIAGDLQLRVIARTTTCPGNDEYGLMYRGESDSQNQLRTYLFNLNCAGQAGVALLEGATITAIKNWETYPAIRSGAPAENALTIWMAKDQFHFYANDQYLFSLTNSASAQGFFGFFARSYSGGGGQLSFDDLVVKEVTAP